jgi:hypothetical protein
MDISSTEPLDQQIFDTTSEDSTSNSLNNDDIVAAEIPGDTEQQTAGKAN